jgi:hypothetical protein
MIIFLLGIIIVLLQSYIRLHCRHKDLKTYLKNIISKEIDDVKRECDKDHKPN